MSRILVTGARGLVGGAISDYLREKGHHVIGTVRKPHQENQYNICVDLSKPNLDLSTFCHNIEAVVHAAAVVPNRKNIANDEKNKEKTIIIDRNVYDFCSETDIPVIYLSGCALYDMANPDEKNEQSSLLTATPYHEAKKRGEELFLKLNKTIIARISSPYGPNLSDEAVLKIFLSKAYRDEKIMVWGSGKREQDFIHVVDIAHFVERALFSGCAGIFNVACGSTITMMDLAKICVTLCGTSKIELSEEPDSTTGYYPRFSVEKADNVFGWCPAITLEKGLENILKGWG